MVESDPMNMRPDVTDNSWLDAPYVRTVLAERTTFRSPATISAYRRALRAFIDFCCQRWNCSPKELNFGQCTHLDISVGDQRVMISDQIRREVIVEFLNTIPAPTVRSTTQTVLRVYFQYLLDLGVVRFNPVPKTRNKVTSKPKQGLSVEEIDRLVQEVLKADEPFRTASLVQLSAGLRFGELRALRMNDVQCVDGEWEITIRRESLKGRREHKLPLPNITDLMEQWMTWRQSHQITSEYLFVGPKGGRISCESFNRRWKQIAMSAGIHKPVSTHDMRRAYATLIDQYIENPDVLVTAMRHAPDTSMFSHHVNRSYVKAPGLDTVEGWMAKLPMRQLSDTLASLWLATRTSPQDVVQTNRDDLNPYDETEQT
jgi:integrase